jgi:HlyD family type I secretion membrane fusion protein
MTDVPLVASPAGSGAAFRTGSDFLRAARRPPVRATMLGGLFAMAAGLGGFGTWAAYAPLASAALAHGVIAVDGSRKVVQHVEGGSIAELLVREGDRVQAGQTLLRLDDLEAKALHDQLEGQYFAFAAQEARLRAESASLDAVTFPHALEAARGRPEVAEILMTQQRIFDSSRSALDGQVNALRQRIAQLVSQIEALRSQLSAGEKQRAIIEDEMADVQSMVDKGLERKPRLLALKRNAAFIEGQQGEYVNRIAQARESIAETELGILNAARARVEKAALELGGISAQRAQVEQRLAEAQVKLGRRDVLAPVAGIVLSLKYRTLGGVIPPGREILEIVPEGDGLVVEAQVSPLDVDVVRVGLDARVMLSAYKSRTTPQLDGKVLQVSADAIRDEHTGQSYFLARIEVDGDRLGALPDVRLAPGMPVEVLIETGERTVLDYLLQPITDSFRRAFREE